MSFVLPAQRNFAAVNGGSLRSLWPVKPELPVEGVNLTCPNCESTSTFKRFELMYRA
jgi:hypothetical protein